MKKEEKKGKYERKLITIAIAMLHISHRLSSIIYNIYIIYIYIHINYFILIIYYHDNWFIKL